MVPPSEGRDSAGGQGTSTTTLPSAGRALPPPSAPSVGAGRLGPGSVVAERFEIEALAGEGGMGAVFRALDQQTGAHVALKVMHARGRHDRFEQEALLLAELSHPAIVAYVAHGTRPGGELYLAMEWLEGETLTDRLLREPLSVEGSLAVVRRAAAGLAEAHARGVVHRDVKPSNLFLPSGDPALAKLLDFGVARLELEGQALTRTGAIVGSAGYMAPEQARGLPDVDERADVFALGCVLFECLTGERAFFGPTVVATLAKVVLQEAPRVLALRPDLPAPLDALVARMLAKDRQERPADMAAVLDELSRLGAIGGAAPAHPPTDAVTLGERRLYSVVLARLPADDLVTLMKLVEPFGGDAARLADGTLLVAITAHDAATDLAAQAASCALALRALHPDAPIAVATGRAETSGSGLVGRQIDRAAELLGRGAAATIPIDEVTAGLLDARFEVSGDGPARVLVGRREGTAGARTLLGRASPFVGREKELALLEATLAECAREPVARAVLVTATAGTGKSRLRLEFAGRVRPETAQVLIARADPISAGAPLALLRQLVRQAAGLVEGEPLLAQRARLEAHLAGLEDPPDADFLGELAGVPQQGQPAPELRAARDDPRLMAERTRKAFLDWVAAECALRPLLLVLEDLHWGDAPSVAWLTEALRRLPDRPLLVLALARPEARGQFQPFWTQEIVLSGLTRRAADRLVRSALGDGLAPALVARIVERADGNAYYLEELIRRVAEGASDEFPETVLAMAQSRLERLEPEARRVLRAASVFGETFWEGGVAALLGAEAEVAGWLRALAGRELLRPREGSRFPQDRAYVFGHGLLREAAYVMLTAQDRAAAHRSAGEWLEGAGEKDARVLADHFERGAAPARAAPWLVLATEAAIAANDFDGTLSLGERGVLCGAAGEPLGRIRAAQALAFIQRDQPVAALERAREAFSILAPGSIPWFTAGSYIALGGFMVGDASAILEVFAAIAGLGEVVLPPGGSVATAVFLVVYALLRVGQHELAWPLCELLERSGAAAPDHDRVFDAFLSCVRGQSALAKGDVGRALRSGREAIALLRDTGPEWGVVMALFMSAEVHTLIGCYQVAERDAREGFDRAREAGLTTLRDVCRLYLGSAVLGRGESSVARSHFEAAGAASSQTVAKSSTALLALALAIEGKLDEAEQVAGPTGEDVLPRVDQTRHAALACVALARGEAARALALLGERAVTDEPPIATLLRIQALLALGEAEAARSALRTGRERILELAATLEGEPEERQVFLGNRQPLLALAHHLLDGPAAALDD